MMKKKTLSQKMVNDAEFSLKDRKVARDLAIHDLMNSLIAAENGETIRFGTLGTFTKTKQKRKIKSKLFNESYGKTYIFYRIGFRASSILKRELDK